MHVVAGRIGQDRQDVKRALRDVHHEGDAGPQLQLNGEACDLRSGRRDRRSPRGTRHRAYRQQAVDLAGAGRRRADHRGDRRARGDRGVTASRERERRAGRCQREPDVERHVARVPEGDGPLVGFALLPGERRRGDTGPRIRHECAERDPDGVRARG